MDSALEELGAVYSGGPVGLGHAAAEYARCDVDVFGYRLFFCIAWETISIRTFKKAV
jgi:hypothetical protein